MPEITIKVDKDAVWEEAMKTSGYTGDKMLSTSENDNPYDRILITDEDAKSLQQFWQEAVMVANDSLRDMLESASDISGDYEVTLRVSVCYDTVLNKSVESSLKSYFIAAIVGRWYKFANKGEAAEYYAQASAMMENARRMLYSRKRPTRLTRRTD
jgi:hypothetical protein